MVICKSFSLMKTPLGLLWNTIYLLCAKWYCAGQASPHSSDLNWT